MSTTAVLMFLVSSLEINTVRSSFGSSDKFTSSNKLACSRGSSFGSAISSCSFRTTYTRGPGWCFVPPHRYKRYAFLPPGNSIHLMPPLLDSPLRFINGTPYGRVIMLASIKAVSSNKMASARWASADVKGALVALTWITFPFVLTFIHWCNEDGMQLLVCIHGRPNRRW